MPEIVLMSDSRVAAVPVVDCGEPLLDVRPNGRFLVDARRSVDSGAFAYLREGVLTRLLDAQELLPDGIRLLFIEGYRPPRLQRRYFAEYVYELRTDNPDWSTDRLRTAASRFVSPPEIAPQAPVQPSTSRSPPTAGNSTWGRG
jgi:D-alanyl-D-alanine dipeptidase